MRVINFIYIILLVGAQAIATPILLVDAYQSAIEFGMEFAIAKSKDSVIREETQQAKALFYPKISLLASYDYEKVDQSFTIITNEPTKSSTLQVILKQPVYDRASWYQIDTAQERELFSTDSLKFTQQEIAYIVSQAYFLQAFNENALDALTIEQKSYQIQLEKIQKQHEKGLSNKLDFLNAQLDLNKSNSKVLQAKGDLKKSSLEFKRLIGKDLSPKSSDISESRYSSIVNTLFKFEQALFNKEFWLKKAIGNSEVVQSASKIKLAKYDKEVQKSYHYPSLSLDITSSRDEQYSIIPSVDKDVLVSLNFVMPLYKGGSTSSKVRAAEVQIQQAKQEYNSNLEMKKLEISTVIDNLLHDQSYIESLRVGVQSARELLDATKKMHQNGLQSLVDVRSAEAKLSLAKNSFLEVLYTTIMHRLELFKLTGGLIIADLTDIDSLLNSKYH
jgi:outer membrane protein